MWQLLPHSKNFSLLEKKKQTNTCYTYLFKYCKTRRISLIKAQWQHAALNKMIVQDPVYRIILLPVPPFNIKLTIVGSRDLLDTKVEAGTLPTSLQLLLFALQTELQHFVSQVRLLHTLRAVLFTVVPKVTANSHTMPHLISPWSPSSLMWK